MNNREDFGLMSLIETVSDVTNSFLSRRELVCNFTGLAGKLKKLEAIDMITKEFKLDGKLVLPIKMKNHVGKTLITGTFYVYEDEKLAKAQVDPTVFSRLEKAKDPAEEKASKPKEAKVSKDTKSADEKKPEAKESKGDDKPKDEKKPEAKESKGDDKPKDEKKVTEEKKE